MELYVEAGPLEQRCEVVDEVTGEGVRGNRRATTCLEERKYGARIRVAHQQWGLRSAALPVRFNV